MAELESAVTVAQFSLLEGLGLVHLHAVERTHLVSVRVSLSAPGSSVPQLAVGRVARSQFVALERSDLQHLRVVEVHGEVTLTPVVAGDAARIVEGGAEACGAAVCRVQVSCGAVHRLSAEATGSGVQLTVSVWD